MAGPSEPEFRMILAKTGLDAHERGVHVIAHGLRDAGFEVIYLGLRKSPEQIVRAALDEDADIIGLSSLAGAHRSSATRVLQLLAEIDDPPLVVLGGVIPQADHHELLEAGVYAIFSLEASVGEIARELRAAARRRREVQRA